MPAKTEAPDLPVEISQVFRLAEQHNIDAIAASGASKQASDAIDKITGEIDQVERDATSKIADLRRQRDHVGNELAKLGREQIAAEAARDTHMRMVTAECNHRKIPVPKLTDYEYVPIGKAPELPIEHAARAATTDTAIFEAIADETSPVTGDSQPGTGEPITEPCQAGQRGKCWDETCKHGCHPEGIDVTQHCPGCEADVPHTCPAYPAEAPTHAEVAGK